MRTIFNKESGAVKRLTAVYLQFFETSPRGDAMNYLLTSKTFRQSLAISIILVLVLIQLPSMRQNSVQALMPTYARAFLLTLRTSN